MFIEGEVLPNNYIPYSMKHDIEKHEIPIIAAGDLNQLPPVGDKPAYLYGYNDVMILDQIMRQKEGSNILYLADRALKGLPIQHGYYGDAMVIYDDEVTNEMLAYSDIILFGTNTIYSFIIPPRYIIT